LFVGCVCWKRKGQCFVLVNQTSNNCINVKYIELTFFVGDTEGELVGLADGEVDGPFEGDREGLLDGDCVGLIEGDRLGALVGLIEGEWLGLEVGFSRQSEVLYDIECVSCRYVKAT